MGLKPADIDNIIDKLRKMTATAQKGQDASTLSSLQKDLKHCLLPRWDDIWPYTTQSQRNPDYKREHRGRGNVKYDLQRDIEQSFLKEPLDSCVIIQNSQKIIDEMECIRVIFDYNQPQAPTETGQAIQKTSGKPPKMVEDTITIWGLTINWKACWNNFKNRPLSLKIIVIILVLMAILAFFIFKKTSLNSGVSNSGNHISTVSNSSGNSSPAITTTGPNSSVIVNYSK